jgi:putative membrane protein
MANDGKEKHMVILAHAWGDGPGGWWPIFPITFWVLVLSAVGFWVWRSGRNRYAGAEAVLAERYARGEIDEEQYRAALAVLKRR